MDNVSDLYRNIMTEAKMKPSVIDKFTEYLEELIKGKYSYISASQIKPPQKDKLIEYNSLPLSTSDHTDKLAVIKLNGGLGTTMGLQKAKSLLTVKDNLNFLDIIARQILSFREKTHCSVPLIFTNSYNTDQDTLLHLKKYPSLKVDNIPLSFTQSKYPRIRKIDFQPFIHPTDESLNWNPPGHGEIYQSITVSGVLDILIKQGIEYLFISNADNLGAVIDTNILNYIINSDIPFLMEVCMRQKSDIKGGHLAEKDNKLILREKAQCPKNEIDSFQDYTFYRYFNTNNLWISLKTIKLLSSISLPLITNEKCIDSTHLYQIETAMGAAISRVKGAKALIVPRSRFIPVKNNADLIKVSSNNYTLEEDYNLFLNPKP